MFGSIETFLFNNEATQQGMDMLVGKGAFYEQIKGVAGAFGKGEMIDSMVEKTTKLFGFDFSAAEASSKFSLEYKPVNEDATPIHGDK